MKENGIVYCLEAVMGPNKYAKYIGKSINDDRGREWYHFRELKQNTHPNNRLQYYYNKYGPKSLRYFTIAKYPKNEILFWEKWWIKCFDTYKTLHGFNLTPGGEPPPPPRQRKCTLTNMITREVVTRNSIKEFAEEFNINCHCLSSLLSGRINYARDWYCPENGNWKPIYDKVISPQGEEYEIIRHKQKDFCKKHQLGRTGFGGLLSGRLEQFKGWTRPDSNGGAIKKTVRFKGYHLISPDGKLHSGQNLTKFGRENNLCQSGINGVVNERIFHYKGWRKYKDGMIVSPFDSDLVPRSKNPQGRIKCI